MKIPQARAQRIFGKLVVSRKEKRCRDPRPLSTPTGEHFRVGHALAQLDTSTSKLQQTGIALKSVRAYICKCAASWRVLELLVMPVSRESEYDNELDKSASTSSDLARALAPSAPSVLSVKFRSVRLLFTCAQKLKQTKKIKFGVRERAIEIRCHSLSRNSLL
jgi:hypothetical protein